MSVIALDIAFANLGWVVMEKGVPVAFGTISTTPTKVKNVKVSDDFASRCMETSSALKGVIEKYNPAGIVGELPSGSQNAKAAKCLGAATGIVTAVATGFDLPCEWISEGDSKKAALDKRSAVKEEVMDWARVKFPNISWPKTKKHFEHIADAVMAYNGLRNGVLVRAFG